MEDKPLNLTEAAEYLKLSAQTVRARCEDGNISYFRTKPETGHIFINKSELDAYIEKCKVTK